MKLIWRILAGLALAILSVSGRASTINPCDIWSWQITKAVPSSLYPPLQPVVPAISATSCAGVFAGNDASGGTLSPSPNLGYLNDGLLNGQGGKLSPTQFISSSQLLDLKTPGTFQDPGWIMLGQLNGNSTSAGNPFNYSSVTPVGQNPFQISDVLTYTQTQTSTVGGTWQLLINPNIVQILNNAGLFQRSRFDHLAFSVKAGEAWAVYDFDFNLINANTGGAFDLSIPFSFGGTWTTNLDFFNQRDIGQDVSHLSVWARDPIINRDIPEPGTVLLTGIGVIVLACIFRRRSFARMSDRK